MPSAAPRLQLAQALGHVGQAFSGFLKTRAGFFLALALEGQAIADQRLDDLAALGLGLGHGPQASQPDLVAGQGRQVGHAGRVSGFGFLGHGGIRFEG